MLNPKKKVVKAVNKKPLNTVKYGKNRNKKGQFEKGNSGKPRGARNKHSILIEALLDVSIDRRKELKKMKFVELMKIAVRLLPQKIDLSGSDGGPIEFKDPSTMTILEVAQRLQEIFSK